MVLIGYDLWQTRFGSDPNIVSRSIQVGNTRRLVVGVAPQGFHFPPQSPTQLIVPATVPTAAPAERKAGWIFGVGRLRPGQTTASALSEFATLSAQFEQEFPEQNRGSEYYVEPLRDALVGDTKRPLLLLLGAVGFVLLIACANVGNLLLARALGRQQEMAVRAALGAGWQRLAAQIVTEALVLALAGGVVGVIVAWRAAPALASLVPESTRIPGLDAVGLNAWVLAFSFGASIAAALLFSAVSCLSLARDDQREALTATRRTTMGAGARRAASGLVVAEIALAAVLLVGAGLTLRSFANLLAVDPGLSDDERADAQRQLAGGPLSESPSRGRISLPAPSSTLEALPEIEDAGAAVVTPLTGNNWTVGFERPEHPVARGERRTGGRLAGRLWRILSGARHPASGRPVVCADATPRRRRRS